MKAMKTYIISTPIDTFEIKCYGTLMANLTTQHLSELNGKASLIDGETGEILRIYYGSTCTYIAP